MADFGRAYTRLMQHEGLYVNDPADRGGETYRGISRHFNPAWIGWEVVDACKKLPLWPQNLEESTELQTYVRTYYHRLWKELLCDLLLSEALAFALFDMSVHMGKRVAIRFLQRATNVANRGGSLWPNLVVDGSIGPKTMAVLTHTKFQPAEQDLAALVMNILRGARYIQIMEEDESQEKFARGWFSRVVLSA